MPFGFHVVLYCYLLAYVLALIHLTISTFSDQLQLLYIFLFYQELKGPVLLQKFIELSDLTILMWLCLSLLLNQLHI